MDYRFDFSKSYIDFDKNAFFLRVEYQKGQEGGHDVCQVLSWRK